MGHNWQCAGFTPSSSVFRDQSGGRGSRTIFIARIKRIGFVRGKKRLTTELSLLLLLLHLNCTGYIFYDMAKSWILKNNDPETKISHYLSIFFCVVVVVQCI